MHFPSPLIHFYKRSSPFQPLIVNISFFHTGRLLCTSLGRYWGANTICLATSSPLSNEHIINSFTAISMGICMALSIMLARLRRNMQFLAAPTRRWCGRGLASQTEVSDLSDDCEYLGENKCSSGTPR